MSMSKAERMLPQYCSCHPRNDYRSFRPEEGKFFRNRYRKTVFICYGCLERNRRSRRVAEARRTSPLEHEALQALQAAGYEFQYQYQLCRNTRFDLAFPRQRLLIEIDGRRWHRSRKAKARDASKKGLAKSYGWRVVHIPNGPGLTKRIMDAITGQESSDDSLAASQQVQAGDQRSPL